MGLMTMTVRFIIDKIDYEVELRGGDAKVWEGFGLPIYEGPIDGLEEAMPKVFRQLLEMKAIRQV